MSIQIPLRKLRCRAWRAVDCIIDAAGRDYDRKRLPRLLPIGPDEVNATGASATRLIVARLTRAMRAERTRGKAGHWTYDLNRHIGLAQALRAERQRLLEETGGRTKKGRRTGGLHA